MNSFIGDGPKKSSCCFDILAAVMRGKLGGICGRHVSCASLWRFCASRARFGFMLCLASFVVPAALLFAPVELFLVDDDGCVCNAVERTTVCLRPLLHFAAAGRLRFWNKISRFHLAGKTCALGFCWMQSRPSQGAVAERGALPMWLRFRLLRRIGMGFGRGCGFYKP